MKNQKELQPILTAIFCINRTNGNEDKDITLLLDYAFRTFFGGNSNSLLMACAGHSKDEMMPAIKELLRQCTQYDKYRKEYDKDYQ